MELQQMRYVVAVAETNNFTRAAERCHVVQSALSHQVARLERELGVTLFARTSRRVRLTTAGAAFLPAARQCLEAADRAAADAAAAIGEIRGRLTVGAIPTVAAVDVTQVLRSYLQRFPHVRVELRTAGSEQLITQVTEGLLDIGFVGLPAGSPPRGVEHRLLAEGTLMAVAAAGQTRATAGRVRLADLAAETHVDFTAGSAGRAQTDQAFAAAGLSREVAFEVTDATLMARVVRAGLAIGFLPSAYLEQAPELADLVHIPISDAPTRTEYVVWSDLGVTPAATAFLQEIGGAPGGVARP